MIQLNAFDENALDYDKWFDRHPELFQSEFLALKELIPAGIKGIEIGVGTGRFAQLFGIQFGVEPSENMAAFAENRGIHVLKAEAENLPISDGSFDYALMINTICFLNDIPSALSEIHRILKPKGVVIIAFIDKNSALGKKYENEKSTNKFYTHADFQTTENITSLLFNAGFHDFEYRQTLTSETQGVELPSRGYGRGSFVVVRASKCD